MSYAIWSVVGVVALVLAIATIVSRATGLLSTVDTTLYPLAEIRQGAA